MRNTFTAILGAPKRVQAFVAMIAVAILVPAALLAWGPTRQTYTIQQPADHVTFNSITNNPNIGDERNFVGIREVGSTNVWHDTMEVQANKEYYVRMYVHNNAAANLNLVAQNVTAKFNLPTKTGKSIQVNGFLNSSNATPTEVYDHATFTNDRDFNLAYVKGSLKYENNAGTFTLPESIFTSTGAKLGYNKMDGKIPGCFQFSGVVTFKVKPQIAQTTNFTLVKKVSKHGANNWVENYQAKPGETVDFVLQYKNTGEVQHDGVTFRDTLPTGMSYVANSTKWGNNRGTYDVTTNDGNLTNGTGINVGSYAPGAAAWVIFSAKMAAADKLPCGDTTLVNKAKVNTGGYSVSDDAKVTVDTPDCVEPKDIEVCELATKKIITIKEDEFDASKHSKTLSDCDEVVKKIKVCNLATDTIITINENDFDANKHSKNLADCDKVQVCDPSTGDLITVPKNDADKYLPDTSEKCKESPEEPEMPTELPKTGATEAFASIASLGALMASSYYYAASRRANN